MDMHAHYRVRGYGRIAFYLIGFALEWTEESWEFVGEDADDPAHYAYNEPEQVENRSMVRAVMVGDDREHLIDAEDLEPLGEDEFCRDCGQIGCGHNVYV